MATDQERLLLSIEAKMTQFDKAMAQLTSKSDRAARGVERRFSRMERNLSGIGAGAFRGFIAQLAAIGGASALIRNFIRDTIEQERVVAQLNATLKSTAGVAGLTSQQLQDLASSLQSMTTFNDEAVIKAESLLLTFTKIGKDVFPDAIRAMLDMSTVLGQDLQASAIQLGKALQDPVLGITALRRVGVNFSADQKVVIRRLVETGNMAEAQAMILKELQVEFGGSAKAARDTLGGALQSLGNAWGDLFELSTDASGGLRQAIEELITEISDPDFKAFVNLIGTFLVQGLADAAREAKQLHDEINTLLQSLANGRAAVAGWFNRVEDFEDKLKGISGVTALGDALELTDPQTRRLADAARTINEMNTDLELMSALQRKAALAGGDLIAGPEAGGGGRIQALEDEAEAIRLEAEAERERLEAEKEAEASRKRSIADIARQKTAVVELIAELERELGLVGATDTQRQISNELRRAGAVATDAQKEQITALITAIETESAAHQQLVDSLDTIRATAGDALSAFNDSLRQGEGLAGALQAALDRVLDSVLSILEQQAINSLFGATGSAGGGIGGLLAGLLGGGSKASIKGFAGGGTLGAGKWGIAGERGPELIRGPASVTPMAQQPIIQFSPEIVPPVGFQTRIEEGRSGRNPRITFEEMVGGAGGSRSVRRQIGLPAQLVGR